MITLKPRLINASSTLAGIWLATCLSSASESVRGPEAVLPELEDPEEEFPPVLPEVFPEPELVPDPVPVPEPVLVPEPDVLSSDVDPVPLPEPVLVPEVLPPVGVVVPGLVPVLDPLPPVSELLAATVVVVFVVVVTVFVTVLVFFFFL